jgi:TolB protein
MPIGYSWSPDRRHVVFAAWIPRVNAPKIFTIAIDGSHRTPLRRGYGPVWSGDGRYIAFEREIRDPSDFRFELFIMHPDGTGQRRLTRSESDRAPSFSPDGRSIVFQRDVPNPNVPGGSIGSEWRTVNVSGRGDRLIASHVGSRYGYCGPQWSPNGKRLATIRSELRPDGTLTQSFVTFDRHGQDERVMFDFTHGYPPGPCNFSWQPL